MNEKKRFGKKFISIALAATMITSITAVAASSSASAVTDTNSKSTAAQTVKASGSDASTFSWDNATVYFMLTDRFYNGNTSNDHSYGRATNSDGSPASGWNTAPGTFHGGDFKGVTQKINENYFNNLGVNAIWITAPYEQVHGYCSSGDATGNFAHYAYHGYYALDYTETDKNMGTKEEFKELVDTAHEHGIRIVLDIVMNHAGYNTLRDMEEYNFGGLKNGYESWKYKLTDVGGFHNYVDYNSSNWSKWWGAGWIRAGLPGYTAPGGDDLTKGLSGLPDFKTESTANVGIPEVLKTKWTKEGTYAAKAAKYGTSGTVSDYLVKWLAEWVETYGIDGFRCDTAKHVELASWSKLKTACTTALRNWKANNSTKKLDDLDFWMTGENWGQQVDNNQYYSQGKFDSMINFAFGKQCSGNSMPSSSNINSTYANYASKINSNDNFNVLTYVSSHDDGLSRGNSIWTGSALLLLPGAVQIFYGDETDRSLLSGNLEDHAYRSDMNWNAVGNSATLKHWQKVGQFRNNHIAVGAGQHTNLSATSGAAFARTYDKGTITDAVAAVIGANANTNVTVTLNGTFSNGTVVTNAYDGSTATVSDGKVTFNSGANGTILIEGPQSSISVSLKGDAVFEGSQTVTLSLKGASNATVTVDNGTPFTAVDGQQFTIGENTEVGGTVTVKITASNAEDTVERIYTFSKKDPNATVSVYFDNSSYNWSTVYAYIYDESGSSKIENAAWPGVAMTLNSTTGLYEVEVPEELWGANAQVMFTESFSTATNRYPADGQPGMKLEGESHKFSANHKWEAYQPVRPTDPTTPTTPTTPTDPLITVLLGDANEDGKISLADALTSQRMILGSITGTQSQLLAADVDGNNKLSLADVVITLRYQIGYTDSYGVNTYVQKNKNTTITV